MNRGLLFLIGGAEDKQGDKIILKALLDITRAANIAVIPTASAYPREINRCYDDAFRALGISAVHCLDIRNDGDVDREENLNAVEEAQLVYFSGGDQVRLVSTLAGTRLFGRIRDRFEAGALHIAGTSAGAAAAGHTMIYGGDYKGFRKGSIHHAQGFGFVDGVTVDTHFSNRRRLPRLAQFLVSGRCAKGIGLDENTAIAIDPNHEFVVLGSGMVTVLNSAGITGSNYDAAADGDPLRFDGLKVGFLPTGTAFSLKRWAILN